MTANGKKRINIIDLVVVIVVIAVVLVGAKMLFGGNQGKPTVSNTVTFTVEATKLDKEVLTYMEEGQAVYDSVSKNFLGTLVAVRETPARTLIENHDAQTIEVAEIPGKIDVQLVIEAKGKIEPPNISVGSEVLKIGKQMHCLAGDAALSGTIVALEYEDMHASNKEESK